MHEMSAALTRQKKSAEWLRDGGKAVPYACRWLSHRRWEDELEKSPTGSGGAPFRQGGQDEVEAIPWG